MSWLSKNWYTTYLVFTGGYLLRIGLILTFIHMTIFFQQVSKIWLIHWIFSASAWWFWNFSSRGGAIISILCKITLIILGHASNINHTKRSNTSPNFEDKQNPDKSAKNTLKRIIFKPQLPTNIFLVNRFHVKSGVFKNNLWKIKKSNIIKYCIKINEISWAVRDSMRESNRERSNKTKILENFYGPARRQKSADNFHIFLVSDWVKNSNILEGIVDYPLEHDWRLKHLSRSQPVSVLYGAGNSKVKTKSSKKKLKLTLHKIH